MRLNILCVFLGILVSTLFAQSYEPLLSRPDINGLTGGGATDLDGIATTGLAVGTMIAVFDGSESRIYRLSAWTAEVETEPTIILPDDFADPANAKVWITTISSDPGETGHGGGAAGGSITALTPAAGLTGGTATDLDGIETTTLALGTLVSATYEDSVHYVHFGMPDNWCARYEIYDPIPVCGPYPGGMAIPAFDSSHVDTVAAVYMLCPGTGAENLPDFVRPDDYADPGNTKVWKKVMCSSPIEAYVRINDNGTLSAAENNFGAGSAESYRTRGIRWNTILNRFDVLTSGIYDVTCYAMVELPNNVNENVQLRVKVDDKWRNMVSHISYVGFNFGRRAGSMVINWRGSVSSGSNIAVSIDTHQGTNVGFLVGSTVVVNKVD